MDIRIKSFWGVKVAMFLVDSIVWTELQIHSIVSTYIFSQLSILQNDDFSLTFLEENRVKILRSSKECSNIYLLLIKRAAPWECHYLNYCKCCISTETSGTESVDMKMLSLRNIVQLVCLRRLVNNNYCILLREWLRTLYVINVKHFCTCDTKLSLSPLS